MKITEFYDVWRKMRVIAIGIAIAIFLFYALNLYSYSLEVEYVGPASEADRAYETYREMENRECHDRVQEGSRDRRDLERASEYERDHIS